jgi:hypothetical protein
MPALLVRSQEDVIPGVIVDTSGRLEVIDLIRLHGVLAPGDVESQWALTLIKHKPIYKLPLTGFEEK